MMKYLIIILTVLIVSCCNISKNVFGTAYAQTRKKVNRVQSYGGTYSFGGSLEEGPAGTIIVYPATKKTALFFLDVCRGAPSYNLGQMFGELTFKDSVGIYDSKISDDYFNCILKFKFSSAKLTVVTEPDHDDCGFGYAVYADNEYKLIDRSIPKYFIDGHGDTTFFKGLTIEKYKHQ